MIFKKMLKNLITINFFIFLILFSSSSLANSEFELWINDFKKKAISSGISKIVVEDVMSDAKFLPKVIEYDRYQPEFYEDTKTYISKRTSKKKVKSGIKLFKQDTEIINKISKQYNVDVSLLMSLMGIETNFGTYLGKMDIISSLATLSFDKRRSEFFTEELITLLKLVDKKIVDSNTLFGSWAGAFGNFQFMPSTIKNYAIDYNKDGSIDLKNIEDSFASASNYLNLMGWNNKSPCFFEINLKKNIPEKYLNTSAKKIKNTEKTLFFLKYIEDSEFLNKYIDLNSAIVTPDIDIVENPNKFSPAYIVFDNYKLILKWNRSLRFALAVCTLKNKFQNEL